MNVQGNAIFECQHITMNLSDYLRRKRSPSIKGTLGGGISGQIMVVDAEASQYNTVNLSTVSDTTESLKISAQHCKLLDRVSHYSLLTLLTTHTTHYLHYSLLTLLTLLTTAA